MCSFAKALPCFPHKVNGNPLSISDYSGCVVDNFKLLVLRYPGADRYILFSGPMFVPAYVLKEPNFKMK